MQNNIISLVEIFQQLAVGFILDLLSSAFDWAILRQYLTYILLFYYWVGN